MLHKIFFQILHFIFLKKKKKTFTLWDFHSFMYPTQKPKVRNIKGRFIERESNWNSGFNLFPWEGSVGEIRNGIIKRRTSFDWCFKMEYIFIFHVWHHYLHASKWTQKLILGETILLIFKVYFVNAISLLSFKWMLLVPLV